MGLVCGAGATGMRVSSGVLIGRLRAAALWARVTRPHPHSSGTRGQIWSDFCRCRASGVTAERCGKCLNGVATCHVVCLHRRHLHSPTNPAASMMNTASTIQDSWAQIVTQSCAYALRAPTPCPGPERAAATGPRPCRNPLIDEVNLTKREAGLRRRVSPATNNGPQSQQTVPLASSARTTPFLSSPIGIDLHSAHPAHRR